MEKVSKNVDRDIAIIGMVSRVPGAENIDEFWQMLVDGREGLRQLTPKELASLQIKSKKNYVAAGGFINSIDLFDADYFGFTPRESAYMDPQHRLWLQACWQALEVSGHAGEINPYVGVFASAGYNHYLQHILGKQILVDQPQATLLGNVSDCLATRVSYALNLTGPSMTIQCGCSSALVAVHQARLALLAKQCDVALAGGISLTIPAYQGYTYVEGGFASPDGHCRPFSDDAAGTVFSSGYGVVVLKRLINALEDGDHIYAVIKGSAINNDGADKASFTAPSVSGQTSVIAKALRVAGINASHIQYIETHGTGTPIGDPIELLALEQACKQSGLANHRYMIGSCKANVGHLDVASGVISLIKTCLMLNHKKIPPQIHFRRWHANCVNADNYFIINNQCIAWNEPAQTERDKVNCLRRAGVSAFGFGGSNAHVILEEAPVRNREIQSCLISNLIILSAKSSDRLLQWVNTLYNFLIDKPHLSLSSLAYSLQVGRKQLNYRFIAKVNTVSELLNVLSRVSAADISFCQTNHQVLSIRDKDIDEIQHIWLSGNLIDWKSAYQDIQIDKIILPSIPLQAQSYWVDLENQSQEKNLLTKQTDPREWFYQSRWVEKIIPLTTAWHHSISQPILIIGNKSHILTSQLIDYFQQNYVAHYLVEQGDFYQKVHATHYLVNLYEKNDLLKLENDLVTHNRLPKVAIFFIPLLQNESLFKDANNPFTIFFNLIKQHKIIHHFTQITTIVSGMSSLYCKKNQPELAAFIGLMRGIGQEFPTIKTQLLDIDPCDTHDKHLKQIISSVKAHTLIDLAVWRADKCWQQEYQLHNEWQPEDRGYFKKHGIYIITGGLGDVGSIHVEFLAKEYQATLILLGRTPIPEKNDWLTLINEDNNKKLQKKLLHLIAWQQSDYAIHVENIDITDIESARNVFQQLINQYKKIDGIIHIAGAGSDMHYKTLTELDWQHCSTLLAPKLIGIQNINQLMTEFNILNCLVISSISSSLAGIGLSAYAATHNMLDAIVSTHYPHFRLMNWDAWNFYQDNQKIKKHGELGSEIDKLAINPCEGLEALKYAFHLSNWQQLFISTANLSYRHQYWAHRGFLKKQEKAISISKRPILHNEYVKPVTLIQQKLSSVWETLLGLEKVGIHDSFFELGGHSLLALELIYSLQGEFQYTCSIVDLFASPTVSQLATKIESSQLKNTDKLEQLNARVNKQREAYSAFVNIK